MREMQAQQLSSIMLPIFFILSFALVAGTDATPLPAMEGDTIDVIFKPPRLRALVGAQRGARARQRMRVNPPQVLLQEMVNENHGGSLSKLCTLLLCLRLERINGLRILRRTNSLAPRCILSLDQPLHACHL